MLSGWKKTFRDELLTRQREDHGRLEAELLAQRSQMMQNHEDNRNEIRAFGVKIDNLSNKFDTSIERVHLRIDGVSAEVKDVNVKAIERVHEVRNSISGITWKLVGLQSAMIVGGLAVIGYLLINGPPWAHVIK